MMDTAFEGQKLQASFTFRTVEAVKRIKINPIPRMTGLPWGLSLAAGIAVVVMTLGSQMTIYKQPTHLMFPSETEMLKAREMPVDILSAPGTSLIAGKQGDTDGGGTDPRSPQSNSLLAPAKGGGTWTQKADMPTARDCTGSAVVDGKIYVIGGTVGAPARFTYTAAVEEYDPATDTWMTRADMPTARTTHVAAAVDGIIYAIGGWAGNPATGSGAGMTTVEAYDPATDMWTRKADMLAERTYMTIAVVDGIIYVIGGHVSTVAPWVTSAVEAYDPATDTWTRKADMPTARYLLAACVIDGRIYVSGGLTEFDGWDSLPTVEVYDPATDTWTQASDMPRIRSAHSASVVAGRMYIIGGGDRPHPADIVDVYDPGTDTWTTAADFPSPRAMHTAAVVDGKIYAIGGHISPGNTLSIVEEYDPGLSDSISVTNPAGKLLRTWGEVKSQ